MIKTYDYAYIVKDKDTKAVGLNRGDLVMVIATKAYPFKKDDPYVQRIYVTVIRVTKDGEHQIPGKDNEYQAYLVDPRNLEKVNEMTQKELEEALDRQYNG